jgi:hypothetical protein
MRFDRDTEMAKALRVDHRPVLDETIDPTPLSLRAHGRRDAPPEDRFREAISRQSRSADRDRFVAFVPRNDARNGEHLFSC